ncbi:hypothetical protein BU17DRAFT_49029 [Hysterangium stoloniferum]|nr:hypothetical protein BU17DRAFT_49029 [Hysterangium stoloniferum]
MPVLLSETNDGLPVPVLSSPDNIRSQKSASTHVSTLRLWWSSFKERLGTGSTLSESLLLENGDLERFESYNQPPVQKLSCNNNNESDTDPKGPIDEVVVDNLLTSDGESHKSSTDLRGTGTGSNPEKIPIHDHTPALPITDRDPSITEARTDLPWTHRIWTLLTWRVYPPIHRFFVLRFNDEKMEAHFSHETWFTSKRLALWASLFYVLNWIIGCILLPKPHPLIEQIFYWGVAPVLTLPLPILVAFDFPRRRHIFYQGYLACSTWSWYASSLVFCGYFPGQKSYFACGARDFTGLLYYASALPAIALFGLGQHRFPAMFPALGIIMIISVGIVPVRHTWVRSVANVIMFQMFLLWLHYLRENADRQLYTLREQLKIQFTTTRKAQVNEREAADSKRRLTSYIFHEVRVPLNTALLAVQNMEAEGSVPKGQNIEFAALKGSLSMMSKVLNDVLDFNRMDSGRFESVDRPYAFHTVLRSMLVPLQLAANARGLELCTDIDKQIDAVARRAGYEAQGEASECIDQKLATDPSEEGVVVGDEMRLRQVFTNLTSNACKFTPSGGKITVRTKLISPVYLSRNGSKNTNASSATLSVTLPVLNGLPEHGPPSPPDSIVVRIEIEDTGAGIGARDLVENNLFSPYVQTEIGRTQGGKGSGLGLALVRHIVKLSGGRLGVRSQIGVGSTFWVELPLGVGKKALLRHDCAARHGQESEPVVPFDISSLTDLRERGYLPLLPSPGTSALKSIMDQGCVVATAICPTERMLTVITGGLVELSPPRLGGTIGEFTVGQHKDTLTVVKGQESGIATAIPSGAKARPPLTTLSEHDPSLLNTDLAVPKPPLSPESWGLPDRCLSALVVDDDFVTRQLMSRLLTRLGIAVTCAENGAVALDLILGNEHTATPPIADKPQSTQGLSGYLNTMQEKRFDIIFLDNQMPVMTGLSMVRRLRELGRTDFVVGITGNALLPDQDEYLEAGVNRVLAKPVQERSLISALSVADQLKKNGALNRSMIHQADS